MCSPKHISLIVQQQHILHQFKFELGRGYLAYLQYNGISSFLIENTVIVNPVNSKRTCHHQLITPKFFPQYYRHDRADGWEGVIIITKKNLIVEEIKIKNECEMVAIKEETYQKPVIFTSCYRRLKNNDKELLFKNKTANQHKEKKSCLVTSICQIQDGKLDQSITTSI